MKIDLDLLADKVADRMKKSEDDEEETPKKKKRKMDNRDKLTLSKLLKLKMKK